MSPWDMHYAFPLLGIPEYPNHKIMLPHFLSDCVFMQVSTTNLLAYVKAAP
jgi:hypothetical protein